MKQINRGGKIVSAAASVRKCTLGRVFTAGRVLSLAFHLLWPIPQMLLADDAELPSDVLRQLGDRRYRVSDLISSFCVNADGTKVATVSEWRNRTVSLVDVRTGDVQTLTKWDAKKDPAREHIVIEVRFSADDDWLIGQTRIGGYRKWHVGTLKEHPMPARHSNRHVWGVRFNAAGELLAILYPKKGEVLGEEWQLRIVKVGGPDLGRVRSHGRVDSARLSKDGSALLLADDRTASYWKKSRLLREVPRQRSETRVLLAFSSDETPLAVFAANEHFRIVDMLGGNEVARMDLGKRLAGVLGISDDGELIATAAYLGPGRARINVTRWRRKETVLSDEVSSELIGDACFSGDGSVLVVGAGNDFFFGNPFGNRSQALTVWNIETGRRIDRAVGHTHPVHSVAWSGDGGVVSSSGIDGTLRLWDPHSGAQLGLLGDSKWTGESIAFSADGKLVVAPPNVRDEWNGFEVWDVKQRVPRHAMPMGGVVVSGVQVAFSDNGKYLATGAKFPPGGWNIILPFDVVVRFGTIEVWDIKDLQKFPFGKKEPGSYPPQSVFRRRGAISKFNESVRALKFGGDGSFLAVASTDRAEELSFWKLPEGDLIKRFAVKAPIRQLSVSPDGQTIAASGTFQFRSDWRMVYRSDDPDEDRSTQAVRIWNRKNGNAPRELKGHAAAVVSVSFSPDGKYLASGSMDKTIRIWDTRDWKPLTVLSGHDGGVLCLAFSPDGKHLASGSTDTTLLIWDFGAIIRRRG